MGKPTHEAEQRAHKAEQRALVDAWNAKHDVGTPVRFWPWIREGEGRRGKTRSRAELLSGHTAVVWITGQVGCIALTHVEAEVGASTK